MTADAEMEERFRLGDRPCRVWMLAFERLAGGSIRPPVGPMVRSFYALGSDARRRLVGVNVA
jgi:hypothetical protein